MGNCSSCKSTEAVSTHQSRNMRQASDTIASDLIQHFFVNDITTCFEFGKTLGEGAFGCVVKGTNKKTKTSRAIKIVLLKNAIDKNALRNEITILKRLHHPNLVKVISSYEDLEKMYMVMQLCTGKELFDHLYKHKRVFSEVEIHAIVQSLLRAVAYLHSNHITHRDLKLENILLENDSAMASVKLCDFGFSKFLQKGERMTKALGTIDYVAPEVLIGDYNEKCDVWSIGVICYELVSGKSPFRAATRDGTMANILDAKLKFDEVRWKRTSQHCKDFILRLVHEDIDERCSALQALELPWMTTNTPMPIEKAEISTQDKLGFIRNLTYFGNCRKMKQTAMLSVALGIDDHLLPQSTFHSKIFHAMDLNKTGTIDLEEFCHAMKEYDISRADAEKLFLCVDQTNSKTINYLEFLAAVLNPDSMSDMTLMEAFGKLDAEGSGAISEKSLLALLKRSFNADEIHDMIASADITGDGCLNFDEFKAMFKNTPRGTPMEPEDANIVQKPIDPENIEVVPKHLEPKSTAVVESLIKAECTSMTDTSIKGEDATESKIESKCSSVVATPNDSESTKKPIVPEGTATVKAPSAKECINDDLASISPKDRAIVETPPVSSNSKT